MKKGIIKYIFSLSFPLFFLALNTFAQDDQDKVHTIVESVIVSADNNPIEGARVYVNKTSDYTVTDENGKFTLSVPEGSDIYVEAEGFTSRLITPKEYVDNNGVFQLQQLSTFFFGEKNDVNIAFRKIKQKDLVGAVSVLNPEEIAAYDNDIMLSNALMGRIPGLYGSSNIRGIGSALFIVDGMPRDISTIKMSEVEQVTFLKDANAAILYGSAAKNGVVLVTTKRGVINKQVVNVSASYGVSVAKELPEYLSSADYMELYNEARENDGLSRLYSDTDIENYRNGDKYRYPNIDYYSSDYIRTSRPFFNLETEFSGGNDYATYYTNAGWRRTTSHFVFGEGENAHTDVFNVRGNVDITFNPKIKSTVDATVNMNQYYGPVGANYWGNAAIMKPNEFTPLLPIDRIDPENELLLARKNDIDGKFLLGGTQSIHTNSIAQIYSGGRICPSSSRTFSFNQKNIFDLSSLTQGLSFQTNISFDHYATYVQAVNNTYSAYEPVWGDNNMIIDLVQYGIDSKTGTQEVGQADYIRRIGGYGYLDYSRQFSDIHYLSGSLLGYLATVKEGGDIQATKNAHLGLRLNYIHSKKYMVDFSSAYVHSSKLAPGNRIAFSPSLGLAWVVSNEDFLASANNIDYLKLRLSAGIINSDTSIDDFFYYDSKYSQSGIFYWYEGQWYQNSYVSNYEENKNLSFEKQKNLNFGFESLLFDRVLGIDANIFWSSYSDQITRPTTLYPSYYSDFIPYQNYGETAYRGAELGLSFNKQFKDFSIVAGANILYATSEIIKLDEVYSNDYQYRKGKPEDAVFGLVADGFFMDEADIAGHSLQAFGDVQPGDIKYMDQNNDGIVDSEDMIEIGRSQAPLSYGLHIKLKYKNLTLFALGNGRMGADSYKSGDYYRVDGDDKYSAVVLNRWTEATKATATYPRLSSVSNNNNFRNSTFWLYSSNYFTIDRVQLTYQLPESVNNLLNLKQSSVYIDGSDIVRFSKNRKIQDLNVGGQPYFMSFSMGVKVMF